MSFTKSVFYKRLMAFAGLVWFAYIVFHVLSLTSFHFGKETFNDFYTGLNETTLYGLMVWVLTVVLVFHVFMAISRQMANHKSKGLVNQKSYPKAIPRVVAWGGAFTLLAFIVFHFMQMQLLDKTNLYQQLLDILTQPIFVIIYIFGSLTLSVHVHHVLGNVLQTLGISSKQYHLLVVLIALGLFVGFVSIPVSVIL